MGAFYFTAIDRDLRSEIACLKHIQIDTGTTLIPQYVRQGIR